MRKLYKLLTVTNISIELDDPCEAKDISRVRLKMYQDADRSRCHATKLYADIHDRTITWHQHFQFRYTDQTRLAFETECEHEYGYELEELQVLYKGVHYIHNEKFFRPDHCHVFSPEGEKKGVLKMEIKVVTKQEEQVKQQVEEKVAPLVREDLIGLIKINNAYLEIINPVFNRKRHQILDLLVKFQDTAKLYEPVSDYKWSSLNLKLQYVQQGAKKIQFQIWHDSHSLLDGIIQCETIKKNKRYISHKITMFNKNGIKVGYLILDLRYVTKQELLDLIYSPNNKLNYSDNYTERSQSSGSAFPEVIPNLTKGNMTRSSPKRPLFLRKSQQKILPAQRYKIGYLLNQNSDVIIPKANRFLNLKSTNPNVSYIDPEKSSDFSPKRMVKGHKQYGMSRASKFDFTRQYKQNPGVGEYQLPSIWSKY